MLHLRYTWSSHSWFHFFGYINKLGPKQNDRHCADDTFKRIFFNKNVRVLIEISLNFVPTGPFNDIPPLVQIMAWRRPGDNPLPEPMMVQFTDAYSRHSAFWIPVKKGFILTIYNILIHKVYIHTCVCLLVISIWFIQIKVFIFSCLPSVTFVVFLSFSFSIR